MGPGLARKRINQATGHATHLKRKTSMKKLRPFVAIALLAASMFAQAADGLVALKSSHSAAQTMDRMESTVKQRGLTSSQ